jgi:predicted transposase YdaD
MVEGKEDMKEEGRKEGYEVTWDMYAQGLVHAKKGHNGLATIPVTLHIYGHNNSPELEVERTLAINWARHDETVISKHATANKHNRCQFHDVVRR